MNDSDREATEALDQDTTAPPAPRARRTRVPGADGEPVDGPATADEPPRLRRRRRRRPRGADDGGSPPGTTATADDAPPPPRDTPRPGEAAPTV
ncbi:MAG: hypothetical protein KY434_09040, partial [Actinobacteria bacterium]|nr:hypothetical protein [Actinomycetota bacterium]